MSLFIIQFLFGDNFYFSRNKFESVVCLQPGQLIIFYELEESEKSSSRGIVEVCPDTHR